MISIIFHKFPVAMQKGTLPNPLQVWQKRRLYLLNGRKKFRHLATCYNIPPKRLQSCNLSNRGFLFLFEFTEQTKRLFSLPIHKVTSALILAFLMPQCQRAHAGEMGSRRFAVTALAPGTSVFDTDRQIKSVPNSQAPSGLSSPVRQNSVRDNFIPTFDDGWIEVELPDTQKETAVDKPGLNAPLTFNLQLHVNGKQLIKKDGENDQTGYDNAPGINLKFYLEQPTAVASGSGFNTPATAHSLKSIDSLPSLNEALSVPSSLDEAEVEYAVPGPHIDLQIYLNGRPTFIKQRLKWDTIYLRMDLTDKPWKNLRRTLPPGYPDMRKFCHSQRVIEKREKLRMKLKNVEMEKLFLNKVLKEQKLLKDKALQQKKEQLSKQYVKDCVIALILYYLWLSLVCVSVCKLTQTKSLNSSIDKVGGTQVS